LRRVSLDWNSAKSALAKIHLSQPSMKFDQIESSRPRSKFGQVDPTEIQSNLTKFTLIKIWPNSISDEILAYSMELIPTQIWLNTIKSTSTEIQSSRPLKYILLNMDFNLIYILYNFIFGLDTHSLNPNFQI